MDATSGHTSAGYEADHVMSTQPSSYSDIENYIIDLDAEQVGIWSPQDVVNNFVEKINCGYANELFLANKINGRSLMLLNESHLKEMGIQTIGDRVYMLHLISLLKKKKKEMETTSSLWSGETPTGGCAYSKNCWHCIRRYVCPCCTSRVYWKVTGQGVFYRNVPPCRSCRKSVSTDYMDYRFFKDLELKEEHLCCCFCQRYRLDLFVKNESGEASGDHDAASSITPAYSLVHPDAPKAEKMIRNAWNAARLVAD